MLDVVGEIRLPGRALDCTGIRSGRARIGKVAGMPTPIQCDEEKRVGAAELTVSPRKAA